MTKVNDTISMHATIGLCEPFEFLRACPEPAEGVNSAKPFGLELMAEGHSHGIASSLRSSQ
jgi:hypothetical protein